VGVINSYPHKGENMLLNGKGFHTDCREELSFILKEDFDDTEDVVVQGLANEYQVESANKIIQRYECLYDYLCLAFSSLSTISGFEEVFEKSLEIKRWLETAPYRRETYRSRRCDLLQNTITIPNEVLWNQPMTSTLMVIPRIACVEASLFEDGWYATTHFQTRTSVLSTRIHKLYSGSSIYRYGGGGFRGFIEFTNRGVETKLGKPEVLKRYGAKYHKMQLDPDRGLVVGSCSSDRYISRRLWNLEPRFKYFISELEKKAGRNGPVNFLNDINMGDAATGRMTLRRV